MGLHLNNSNGECLTDNPKAADIVQSLTRTLLETKGKFTIKNDVY